LPRTYPKSAFDRQAGEAGGQSARKMIDDVKQQYGWLAAKFGKRQLPLEVCKGPASWSLRYYLGTREDGERVTRESVERWPTREKAERALMSGGWTQRLQL
jgi:hypothetical protein